MKKEGEEKNVLSNLYHNLRVRFQAADILRRSPDRSLHLFQTVHITILFSEMCHASDTCSPLVYQNVAFAGSAQRVSFRKD